MFSRKKPEVLVVGAGPVGLFTALCLSDQGIRVQIVDRAQHTGTRSYALALHAKSLRLLEELEILPEVLEQSRRIRNVGLYDLERRRAVMSLSELPEDYSFLAVVPQNGLERILEQALARRGVKVEWLHSVSNLALQGDGVDVGIDKLTLDTLGYSVQHTEWVVAKSRRHTYPFVVGTDGNSSIVRRAAEIPFPSYGERSEFAVFEFSTDADLGDEMRLVFGDDSVSVCWPMPGGRCRWSFGRPLQHGENDRRAQKDQSWVQLPDQQFPELSEDFLRGMLASRAPWFRGGIEGIHWRMDVRFERRLAERFGRDRVWLAGDASHLTGPAGIQSMNVGLREGRELADIIRAALLEKASPEDFERYDEGRGAEWRGLLGIDPMFEAGPHTDPWVAAQVDRLLPCVPASGEDLVRLMAQVGVDCLTNDFAKA